MRADKPKQQNNKYIQRKTDTHSRHKIFMTFYHFLRFSTLVFLFVLLHHHSFLTSNSLFSVLFLLFWLFLLLDAIANVFFFLKSLTAAYEFMGRNAYGNFNFLSIKRSILQYSRVTLAHRRVLLNLSQHSKKKRNGVGSNSAKNADTVKRKSVPSIFELLFFLIHSVLT